MFFRPLSKLRAQSLGRAQCCCLEAKQLQQNISDKYFDMGLLHDDRPVLILTLLKQINGDHPMRKGESLQQAGATLNPQFTTALTKR